MTLMATMTGRADIVNATHLSLANGLAAGALVVAFVGLVITLLARLDTKQAADAAVKSADASKASAELAAATHHAASAPNLILRTSGHISRGLEASIESDRYLDDLLIVPLWNDELSEHDPRALEAQRVDTYDSMANKTYDGQGVTLHKVNPGHQYSITFTDEFASGYQVRARISCTSTVAGLQPWVVVLDTGDIQPN